jgi:S1-C subfamily serine protease
VTDSRGDSYSAALVGTFTPDDLAVVRAQGATLPAVALARSGSVQVGDIVLAMPRSTPVTAGEDWSTCKVRWSGYPRSPRRTRSWAAAPPPGSGSPFPVHSLWTLPVRSSRVDASSTPIARTSGWSSRVGRSLERSSPQWCQADPRHAPESSPCDVITAIGGQPVSSAADVSDALATLRPGQIVSVSLIRADRSRATLKVTLGQYPGSGR